jgi:ATP-dependent helicase/nuclease subunit A
VNRPAALSVGALTKEGRVAPSGWGEIRGSDVHFAAELHLPRCVQSERKLAPTEVGSATHLVLQHLDVSRPCDKSDIVQQVQQLVDRRLLEPSMQPAVNVQGIDWMMNQTPVGALLRRHEKTLRRELAVHYPRAQPPPGVTDAEVDPMDRIMIRGRLDALLEADDGLVVIDYKTDRVNRETIDARADFYREQMESYSEAIRAISGREVSGVFLVFLAAQQIKSITLPGGRLPP